MSWWVYKNNSTNHTTERLQGDWHAFFDKNRPDEWGYDNHVPALRQVSVGDHILCYQSNLNELVGLADLLAGIANCGLNPFAESRPSFGR